MAVRTANTSGNWGDTATWSGSTPPGIADSWQINKGVTVTIPAGYSAASGTGIIGNSAGALSGEAVLINNGTFTINNGANVKVGNGAGLEGRYTFGPGSMFTSDTGGAGVYNFNMNNGVLDSTATRANPGRIQGAGTVTNSLATPRQNINLSHVIFRNTGIVNFVLQDTTGAQTSALALDSVAFIGTGALTFGSTSTPNTTSMAFDNCAVVDLKTPYTFTFRRINGGAATFRIKHPLFWQSDTNRILLSITTEANCQITDNVMLNATHLGTTAISPTWNGGLWTTNTVNAGVVVLSDTNAAATFINNYIFSTKDAGANIHPIQTSGGGGSGTHTITDNLLDGYADATNDAPDMLMPATVAGNVPLAILFARNIVVYCGELANGAHGPVFTNGITIRNNTMAGTISPLLGPSGDIYRPEGDRNTGTINIRSNLHRGNGYGGGEFSIGGSDTGGGATPQVIASSDYNNMYNVSAPYGNQTGGLTITAGNTGKTVPGAHETNYDPNFFDPRRDMAVWNSIFGSGVATRDAAFAYWTRYNGYRGSPNFDLNGGALPWVPNDMRLYVAFGFGPTELRARGAGDPADGSLDVGAMPVRSKTTSMVGL